MTRTTYEFNTKNNNKSWNINAYNISSISGDDLILEASENNNIINIGNIVPGSSNSYDLGNSNNKLRNIYVAKVIGNVDGNLNGNALTASSLKDEIKIGGISFNGSSNLNLPGVNLIGNQNTTGNAGSANKLKNKIKIGGTDFDGSSSIDLAGVNKIGNQDTTGNAYSATKLQKEVRIEGVLFDGSKDIVLPEIRGAAKSSLKLYNEPKIGGVLFDGSQDIDLPGVNKAGNQNTTGSASVAYRSMRLERTSRPEMYIRLENEFESNKDKILYKANLHNFIGNCNIDGSLNNPQVSYLTETLEKLVSEVSSIKDNLKTLKDGLNVLNTINGI
tara:strand:- start:437 stop:1429 length:993 start_codon:yes stop_codon:yes gene_type:complete